MPLQATSGAASYDAFGGGAPAALPTYIEDVFSTYLYTGNSSTQTIINGIDLSTKGGLVWIKRRTSEAHYLFDTSRGVLDELNTDGTGANETKANSLTSFNTTGFSLGSYGGSNYSVAPDNSYVSWTFRKQPKYFDIQTWTGTGANRTISHSLDSVPACIIVKRTDTTSDWQVYHRSLANTEYLVLNSTAATATGATRWNSTTPTSSVFSLGTDASVNASAGTYVAYIFAHDAGGFGLTGTDNVISCGSFTTDGSGNATVSLGYEPQWIMTKGASGTSPTDNWFMKDNMRGMPASASSGGVVLRPNTAGAETTTDLYFPTATGFTAARSATTTYIYIAIRRGPMKVPTLGTDVFAAVSRTGTDANAVVTAGFAPDFLITKNRFSSVGNGVLDRLRGLNSVLTTTDVAAEDTVQTDIIRSWNMTGLTLGPDANTSVFNWSSNTYINYMFRRAAGYFDEVCYTGTGSNTTQAHNLTTVPELIFVKRRNASAAWQVYSSALANTEYLVLDSTAAKATGATRWNSTTPTSSVFSLGTDATVNASGGTYIAYLFSTCAGVSKVGSYTGTATTKQIDCGFTAGARFVLIKRTDSTGDWYVWDSIRGIVSGNDPYILLNSGVAEVTSTDYVDTYSAGFEISSTAPAAINANGGTYIFLAIA